MKAELIIPIESLRGKLRKDGYYFRMYRGQQIVQKCPDRSKHVKTANEAANQERFAAEFAGKRNRRTAEKDNPAYNAGLINKGQPLIDGRRTNAN